MSETKWPLFIELCRVDGGIPLLYDESNYYHDALSYARTDAARAWQALRDWLDKPTWQPIETAPSGKPVLVHYRNSHGKSRVIKARRVERWTEEASVESEEGCYEYSEEHDTYYITEGWWECIDNWPDYTEVKVSEGEPTHWQPMPKPPSEVTP